MKAETINWGRLIVKVAKIIVSLDSQDRPTEKPTAKEGIGQLQMKKPPYDRFEDFEIIEMFGF